MHRAAAEHPAAAAAAVSPPPVPPTPDPSPGPGPGPPCSSVSVSQVEQSSGALKPPSPAAAVAAAGWSLSPAPAVQTQVQSWQPSSSSDFPPPSQPQDTQPEEGRPKEVEEEEEEVLRMPTRIGNPKRNSAGKGGPAGTGLPNSASAGGWAAGKGAAGPLVPEAEQFAVLRDRARMAQQPPAGGGGAQTVRRTSAGPVYDNPMQRPDLEEFGDDDEEEGRGAHRDHRPLAVPLNVSVSVCLALDSGSSRLSQFLTREERRAMSAQQRSTWRAKQQDMQSRRRNFHGAVTYMFDGIFSWQMYGSADAVGRCRS